MQQNNNQTSFQNPNKRQKTVELLKTRVSFLRGMVYIVLGILVLMTTIAVFSIYYNLHLQEFYVDVTGYPESASSQATLFLSPSSGEYQVGEEFTIDIFMDTDESDIVASAAYLSYDEKSLEAVSVDVSDSVFTMQAEKEIIQEEGKIKITRGKPTPGVNTDKGKIASIRFKALEPTDPQIDNIYFDFTSRSSRYSTVILDDKKGTNVLSSVRGAKITVVK